MVLKIKILLSFFENRHPVVYISALYYERHLEKFFKSLSHFLHF